MILVSDSTEFSENCVPQCGGGDEYHGKLARDGLPQFRPSQRNPINNGCSYEGAPRSTMISRRSSFHLDILSSCSRSPVRNWKRLLHGLNDGAPERCYCSIFVGFFDDASCRS